MGSRGRLPQRVSTPGPGCRSASHRSLFEPEEPRCDVCHARVDPEGSGAGHAVEGRGLLMWSRGDTTRWEEPLLCAACGSAIALSALREWQREDEED